VRGESHDDMYCTRAAISMIVDYFGGSLSQDRISYYHYGGGDPEDDLGHGKGLWPCQSGSWSTGDCVFGWALNGSAPTSIRGKPTFTQTRNWIDASRPILIVENNDQHSVVMDGYDTNGNLAHRVDPWTATASWVSWSSWNVSEYHVPPAGASVRSDEASLSQDSDGDGIVNWDETTRLHTDPNKADTDGDWVHDKQDIREYVFDAAGSYSKRSADTDGDSQRKEVDADNDNDGTPDGCEDTNGNGIYEAASGETDNFSSASHQPCVPKLSITYPVNGDAVNAGDINNPDKLLIHLRLDVPNGWTLSPAAGDFTVTVGTQGPVTPIQGLTVGGEFWIQIQAPTQSTAAYYDLTVWYQGLVSATQSQAVYYLPRQKVDEVVVVDNSGSMASYNKMTSAQNAARLFLDHWTTDDMVGVVAFSTTVSTRYNLTAITSGGTTLTNAKAQVNAMPTSPPGNWLTAMGSGLLAGQTELTTRGDLNHEWNMVLLSDGMENVAPYWNDAAVHNTIVPTKTVVNVVAVGPPHAAWYSRLQQVASDTHGEFWPVDETTSLAASGYSPAASPFDAFPTSLANRLADAYKAAAERGGHQQRLWEGHGYLDPRKDPTDTYEVNVPKNLPEAIFAVNWSSSGNYIDLQLFRPDGSQVKVGDPGVEYHEDSTHKQFRILNPPAGMWVVRITESESPSEYIAFLSGRTPLTLRFAFGLPPEQRFVGAKLPLIAFLSDYKGIAGATVKVYILGPGRDVQAAVTLYDDGAHDDGRADDGIYANSYTLPTVGIYSAKVYAEGTDNDGNFFERHLTRGFSVLPRAAYIWKTDAATAQDYKDLLENNGLATTLIPLADVSTTDLSVFKLLVVGPDTGAGGTWGDTATVNAIAQSGLPVIGLSEGGYAFFGKLGLAIGYPQGAHGTDTTMVVVDDSQTLYNNVYPIGATTGSPLTLYGSGTNTVYIYSPKPPAGVVLIGRDPQSASHYPVIQQTYQYLLWGFQGGPTKMSTVGQQLFTNVAWYMIP